MGNACCRARSAAVASAPVPERQRLPEWTEVVPLFREGVRGHPTVKERYVFKRLLGAGGFGVVWLAVGRPAAAAAAGGAGGESTSSAPARGDPDRPPRRRVACKTIPWSSLKRLGTVEDLRRELSVMASLPRHPALVRLHEVYEDEAAVHLLMDLCDGGSLADRITTTGRREACAEHRAMRVARALVEAVRALHEAGVMHRDLKPDNLMFSGRGAAEQLKVIDFGFAINFRPGETLTDEVGSVAYMAPEVFARSYGPDADVWSAGVIVYQLLCGRHPFPPRDDTYEGQRKATLRGGAADVEGHPWPLITGGAKSLILAMLEPDPTSRPKALQLLEHPWLKTAAIASEEPADSRGLV